MIINMLLVFTILLSMTPSLQALNVSSTSFDMNLARRYVEFTGAAYCVYPRDTVVNWTCTACLKYPGFIPFTFHDTKANANGFVGYDPSANEIVVSFAGTNPLSIKNWIDDLDYFKTTYGHCSTCSVHRGFYESYLAVNSDIMLAVQRLSSTHSTASLAVTGHSLGASLAVLCAAELTVAGFKVNHVYTFGQPRVGDANFEKWYFSKLPFHYRVVHHMDPVPHLPLQAMGFQHMPTEIFYKDSPDQYQVCVGPEDDTCSDQYLADLLITDHLNYCGMDFTANFACQL
jgi:hypothetical protein